jgi:hypothetical protein
LGTRLLCSTFKGEKDPEQKTLLLFIPKNPAGITAGMTTFYSQPNPGNALASENKSRQP